MIGKTLATAQSSAQQLQPYYVEKAKAIKPAEAGSIAVVQSNGSRALGFLPAVVVGNFCVSTTEVNAAKASAPANDQVVYDLVAKAVHVNDGTGWKVVGSRSLEADHDQGRFLFARNSGKLFYFETAKEYYHLNSKAF